MNIRIDPSTQTSGLAGLMIACRIHQREYKDLLKKLQTIIFGLILRELLQAMISLKVSSSWKF